MKSIAGVFLTLWLVTCALGTTASEAPTPVSVELAPWKAHKSGAFLGQCEFEIFSLDILQDADGNIAFFVKAKREHPSSRRYLHVFFTPQVVRQLAPTSPEAQARLLHRKLTVVGKFHPVATEPLVLMLHQGPPQYYYTARIDVKDIAQLKIGPALVPTDKQSVTDFDVESKTMKLRKADR